eukprot:TRINITY_DN6656_c0_g1_i1.p1 TRINITY_DN6656_c0_g1~~TRINITY_DN6656_c0_g1_i1.p1  ORF type:complete len:388 (-),score=76.44 TRINITY_DN6656_c0_g1_i1:25-1056(-)
MVPKHSQAIPLPTLKKILFQTSNNDSEGTESTLHHILEAHPETNGIGLVGISAIDAQALQDQDQAGTAADAVEITVDQSDPEKAKLMEELANHRKLIQQLSIEKLALQQRESKRVGQLKQSLAKLEAHSKYKEQMEKDKHDMLQLINQLKLQKIQLENEKSDWESSLDAQKAEKNQMENQFGVLHSAIENIQVEAESREQKLSTLIKSLEEDLANARISTSQLQDQLEEERNQHQSCISEASQFKLALESARNESKSLLGQVSDERARTEMIAVQAAALQDELRNLKAERDLEAAHFRNIELHDDTIMTKLRRGREKLETLDSRVLIGSVVMLTLLILFIFTR